MPITTNIFTAIKTKIEAMTTAAYNLNWGNTNILDLAHVDFNKYGASANIEPMIGENADEDGAHASAYTERVLVNIRVRVPLVSESMIANYDIISRIMLALDDLKQGFADADINGYYLGFKQWEILYKDNNDAFIPYEALTHWELIYTQDRDDPEQAGDV